MTGTDYLFVYTDFVRKTLDALATKYCYKYRIHAIRQLDFRDEALCDVGKTFCYICSLGLNRPHNVDFATYLKAALKHQVKYSIIKQLKYYQNSKKDAVYCLQKFGKSVNGQIIDLRVKDPSKELFRLSFDDFDFSPLNKTEKDVIQLFFWGNLKIKEIADVLDINSSVVRQHKTRALKKLKISNKHLCH